MPITQCPRCELTFTDRSEMQWHLRDDHPASQATESGTIVLEVAKAPAPAPSGWSRFWRNLRTGGSG